MNTQQTSKRRLVYLLSPSFSGSTLLTLLLAQHPRIATIGELKATAMGPVDDYSCSCGQLIKKCNFWKALSEQLNSRQIPFSFETFGTHFSANSKFWNRILNAQVRGPWFESLRTAAIRHLPGLQKHFHNILNTNASFIETACHLMNADIFLDGSKDPHRLLYFIRSGMWDISVIRIYRDGRAQSHSRRQKPRNPVDFEAAAHEWYSTIQQMDHISKLIPPQKLLTVYYEKLCLNPGETLNTIWQFLGLEKVEMNWQEVDLKSSEHHILGNRMRTKQTIQIRLDEKWRTEMKPEELHCFDRIAGKTNRQLGYTER